VHVVVCARVLKMSAHDYVAMTTTTTATLATSSDDDDVEEAVTLLNQSTTGYLLTILSYSQSVRHEPLGHDRAEESR